MDNSLLLIIMLLALIAGALFTLSLISRRLKEIAESQKPDDTLLKYFKQDLQDLKQSMDQTKETVNKTLMTSNKNLTDSLHKSQREIHDRLSRAAEVIGELKKEAGQFTEISRSMQDLQHFLKSPKLRGNIGEAVLKDLISQIFPRGSFKLQYSFNSGEKVDAAILTDAGILPIDSKFPMENFQKMSSTTSDSEKASYKSAFIRDIRKHVRDIAVKYILPEENTLDFALMYIPSESVYYEVMIDTDLSEYARKTRVYPVSPNTLYAALQTILLSFEGKKIEQKAKEVFRLLRALEKDYEKSTDILSVLGTHLTNAYNKFSDVQSSFNTLGQKLSSSRQLTGDLEEEKLIE